MVGVEREESGEAGKANFQVTFLDAPHFPQSEDGNARSEREKPAWGWSKQTN